MKLKPIYQKIYDRAKPYLRTRNNLTHVSMSLRYTLKLLKYEKGNEDIVIPAILLHDVGWKMIPEDLHLTAFGPNPSNPKLGRFHEVAGAKIARSILDELTYPPEKVSEICRLILGHDSRNRALSCNDRILKDADKLWRYSRRGFSIDLERFPTSRRKAFLFLEEKIEEWFFLPKARLLARRELARRRKEWFRSRQWVRGKP